MPQRRFKEGDKACFRECSSVWSLYWGHPVEVTSVLPFGEEVEIKFSNASHPNITHVERTLVKRLRLIPPTPQNKRRL